MTRWKMSNENQSKDINGTIGGYVPTNVRNSRHISTYEPFVKIRKYINCINSSHVETVVLMSKVGVEYA